MSTVAVSKLVQAPVGELWRVFTDLAARGRYLSTVESVEVLTPGPFGTGTRWLETRTLPDGTRVTEEFVVNEVVPRVLCASPRRASAPTTGSPIGSLLSTWGADAAGPW